MWQIKYEKSTHITGSRRFDIIELFSNGEIYRGVLPETVDGDFNITWHKFTGDLL